jgi:predicted nucleic acid-binding Zn ribbon protein
MNCPKCGTSIVDHQNFCRDCGERVTERPRVSRMQLGGLAVLAMMFIGLLVAMFGKMFAMKWVSYSGLVVMFIGAFIIAAYGFLRETAEATSYCRDTWPCSSRSGKGRHHKQTSAGRRRELLSNKCR